MKVKLLASAILASLITAGTASAAFVESTDGTFSGVINFSGEIVTTAPDWGWEIPETSKAAAKLLNVNHIDGVVTDDTIKFSFADDIQFVHGYMLGRSESAGLGFTPSITVTTANGEQAIDLTGGSQAYTVAAVGTLETETDIPGTFEFSIKPNVVVNYLNSTAQLQQVYSGAQSDSATVLSTLQLQSGYAQSYPNTPTISYDQGANVFAQMRQAGNSRVSSAVETVLANHSVSWNVSKIPTEWTATIPLTINLI